LNFPFFIARRYLVSKKSHNAINIISIISVGGVCIGTMALIIVLSAFNGISDLVSSLYNSFNPELVISPRYGKTFDPHAREIQKLKEHPSLAHFTEVMEGNALLKYDDRQCIATIKGVGDSFRQMSGFDTLIREGSFNLSGNNVVMAIGLSRVLQVSTSDMFNPVSVYAPRRGNTNSLDPEESLNELKIYPAGLFSINDDFDYKYVIMDIGRARALLDYKNEVSSIELALKPGTKRKDAQEQISSLLGDRYKVENREQQNAVFYKTVRTEKLWTFIILSFILVIATFNVIGSLTMLIIEKKKDMHILHHMGAGLGTIRRIFLLEGMLITFIGAFSGILLGTLICFLQKRFSLVKFSEGYVVDAYPISFQMTDFILVIIVVMIIGLFAAWYPVRVFTRRHLAGS
jgi:ABC-type lipoprotein release transport system permease subunit